MANASPSLGRDDEMASAALSDALEVLLSFGCAMLKSGDTAFRVREWMEELARKMGFDALSVSFTLSSVTISVRRRSERATMMREIEPPGINARQIGELERLVRAVRPGQMQHEIALRVREIEAKPPRYSLAQTATGIGAACGAFAFLNGGAGPEIVAAGIGGGDGQWLRSLLSRRGFNHFGITALCAVVASSVYALIALLSAYIGLGIARYSTGFVSSVLFLIPGFPLVAALLDLLQYQTVVAVARLAYSAMILLAATFGLSFVAAVIGFDVPPTPTFDLSEPLNLLLRAIASFAGGCGFAILYNSSARSVLVVGLLAFGSNELRLALHDAGMMLAPATFLGALAVGLLASLVHQRLSEPRIALTVPSIIIMVPGLYAFEMIVLFNQGHMLDALQAAASCGFVVGAMAMGLAAARMLGERR
jgi:uncharacterized membrane protein YjjP (DUF1212 family)